MAAQQIYRGFSVKQQPDGKWVVLTPDGEKLSSKLDSDEACYAFIDRYKRMGGK